jgi:hypothetical protein
MWNYGEGIAEQTNPLVSNPKVEHQGACCTKMVFKE